MENDVEQKHIMFSYSWEHKNDVNHIYSLVDNEFKEIPKWIDTQSMSGNIIEAMSNAIENAFLVIIFLSKSYKNSKNCKIESELIIGKRKDYILVLNDNNFPYLENGEETNWVNDLYKDQFYIDLSDGMDETKILKLLDMINEKIISYYDFDVKPTFTKKNSNPKIPRMSLSPLKKNNSGLRRHSMPSISLSTLSERMDTDRELDNFISKNNLEQNDINNIKDLIQQTPRTMIPTLKASGMSFKGILEIINDIKNN